METDNWGVDTSSARITAIISTEIIINTSSRNISVTTSCISTAIVGGTKVVIITNGLEVDATIIGETIFIRTMISIIAIN